MPGITIAFRTEPKTLVGGDFCDVHYHGSGVTDVLVGDASARGLPGALLATYFLGLIRAMYSPHISLADLAERVNHVAAGTIPVSSYCYTTLLICRIDTERGLISCCNAGNFPPLMIAQGAETCAIGGGGVVLGAFSQARFAVSQGKFNKGDLVALFTDGAFDAMNDHDEYIGSGRLPQVIQENSAADPQMIVDRSFAAIHDWTEGGSRLLDDFTLLVARLDPSE